MDILEMLWSEKNEITKKILALVINDFRNNKQRAHGQIRNVFK